MKREKVKSGYNRNYQKWFCHDVLAAIKKYSLIKQGDRVCVALSGGKDSTTLLYILHYLQHHSHLNFSLQALHVKIGKYHTGKLEQYCTALGVPYYENVLRPRRKPQPGERICYICARLKRGAMVQALKKQGISKVAFGHHATDAAETFFMNIINNKKLGSFSPRVGGPGLHLEIIRPLIYLDEQTIQAVHHYAGLPVLKYKCPYAQRNIRRRFKPNVRKLDTLFKTTGFTRKLIDSLENVDYTNLWPELMRRKGVKSHA